MNENLKPYPYTIGLYQLEKHTLPCLSYNYYNNWVIRNLP